MKKEFYEGNGKIVTTYPVVKNTVSKELIDSIPDSVAERRDFLKKHLKTFSDASAIGIKKAAALWDHQPSRNNRNGASITLDDAKILQKLLFVK